MPNHLLRRTVHCPSHPPSMSLVASALSTVCSTARWMNWEGLPTVCTHSTVRWWLCRIILLSRDCRSVKDMEVSKKWKQNRVAETKLSEHSASAQGISSAVSVHRPSNLDCEWVSAVVCWSHAKVLRNSVNKTFKQTLWWADSSDSRYGGFQNYIKMNLFLTLNALFE